MDNGRSLLLNGVPPLWGLSLFRLRWRKHGQEFRRGLTEKSNQNQLRWTASWVIGGSWRALTDLPYHGLRWCGIPAAPCAVLLSVRAHPKLAAWLIDAKHLSCSCRSILKTMNILQMKTLTKSKEANITSFTGDISHIRFWAVQLCQGGCFEKPLPLAQRCPATLTRARGSTGQGLGTDSQLPGCIWSVCSGKINSFYRCMPVPGRWVYHTYSRERFVD